MEILEDADQWFEAYQNGWLTHFKQTGETNWQIYNRPTNTKPISGRAIDLSQSRLILVSSAGSYLADTQEPYDAPNLLGDYSIRLYPSTTQLDDLALAQDHYDHAAVNADRQVLIPLRHLDDLVSEGVIGELAPNVISFHGYQPDVTRTLSETIPAIIEVAKKEEATGALLVPA